MKNDIGNSYEFGKKTGGDEEEKLLEFFRKLPQSPERRASPEQLRKIMQHVRVLQKELEFYDCTISVISDRIGVNIDVNFTGDIGFYLDKIRGVFDDAYAIDIIQKSDDSVTFSIGFAI